MTHDTTGGPAADKLIEQIKANRKAGTAEPFTLFAAKAGRGYTIAVENDDGEFISWGGFDWRRGCKGFKHAKADASRCSIIPEMEARMMADEGVTPKVGGVYTVSPDFQCGDRSWVDCFWRALSFSGPNVLVEIVGRHEKLMRLFRTDDRAWYP
ncbi:MAG TPA: hypothetical protein VKP88_01345, partial [Candidatus Paceibacterota bacterium]|nr:hypothetical protein [Candidatus Paceibacterota bacterium]